MPKVKPERVNARNGKEANQNIWYLFFFTGVMFANCILFSSLALYLSRRNRCRLSLSPFLPVIKKRQKSWLSNSPGPVLSWVGRSLVLWSRGSFLLLLIAPFPLLSRIRWWLPGSALSLSLSLSLSLARHISSRIADRNGLPVFFFFLSSFFLGTLFLKQHK